MLGDINRLQLNFLHSKKQQTSLTSGLRPSITVQHALLIVTLNERNGVRTTEVLSFQIDSLRVNLSNASKRSLFSFLPLVREIKIFYFSNSYS
jgi:hypothetical protein